MYNFAVIFVIARYVDAPVTALFPALQMPAHADVSRLADPRFMISSAFNLDRVLGARR